MIVLQLLVEFALLFSVGGIRSALLLYEAKSSNSGHRLFLDCRGGNGGNGGIGQDGQIGGMGSAGRDATKHREADPGGPGGRGGEYEFLPQVN